MCYDKRDNSDVQEKLRHDIPMPTGNAVGGTTAQGMCGYEMSDEEKIRQLFTHHAPTLYTGQHFETIRSAAKHLAEVICANVPRGADRNAAIRKVREAMMTANAGIALQGLSL
jgi:hypothetical protein